MRRQVEEIIQEPIAEMPTEAQAQFTKLAEGNSRLHDEIFALKREVQDARMTQVASEDVARLSQEVAKIINLGQQQAGGQQQQPGLSFTPAPGVPQTPNTVSFGNTVKFPLKTPQTPGGQAMLTKQLNALSLPPEEWADEVRSDEERKTTMPYVRSPTYPSIVSCSPLRLVGEGAQRSAHRVPRAALRA